MKKLKIYCCYHDPSQLMEDGNEWYYAKDDKLNPFINEMTMFYHIWKNDKDSDYIGTCHYRRRILAKDVNLDLVSAYSAVGYELYKVKNSQEIGLKDFATGNQCEFMFGDFVEYTKLRYGADNIYIEMERNMRHYHKFTILRNSFVLTRDVFMGLCDFMFGFLDYYDKVHNLNGEPQRYIEQVDEWTRNLKGMIMYPIKVNDRFRLVGYFMEKLVDVYLQTVLSEYHQI